MQRVRVKICGIGNLEETQAALECGADALGFNFWPRSPRYIEPEVAQEIISKLPPFVSSIGVFVNEEPEQIVDLARRLGLAGVQLHGDESPEFCAALSSLKVIRALRVGQDFDPAVIRVYDVSAVLLDTNVKGSYGGTGQRFDWDLALEAKRFAPIILAGGLTSDNVADAIAYVRPMAIDVCSGVEAEPGRKDLNKLRKFMAAVAGVNSEGAFLE